MSAVPTIYRSTDVGAPVLSGTPGAFAALLDAVLVDGYGSGGNAKPPLGWTRDFSSGHKRVFRNNSSAGGTGYSIRFDDSGTLHVGVLGYESMTDVDTGLNAFTSSPAEWQKSATENTTAREWTIVGNDRSVYYFVNSGGTSYLQMSGWFFGDLNALGAADDWCFGYTSHVATGINRRSSLFYGGVTGRTPTIVARPYHGGAIGAELYNRSAMISGMNYWGISGGVPYPYPTTNGVVLSRGLLTEDNLIRAVWPGMWVAEHENIHEDNGIYSGFADLPPGTQLLCKIASHPTTNSQNRALIDLTNPWY